MYYLKNHICTYWIHLQTTYLKWALAAWCEISTLWHKEHRILNGTSLHNATRRFLAYCGTAIGCALPLGSLTRGEKGKGLHKYCSNIASWVLSRSHSLEHFTTHGEWLCEVVSGCHVLQALISEVEQVEAGRTGETHNALKGLSDAVTVSGRWGHLVIKTCFLTK